MLPSRFVDAISHAFADELGGGKPTEIQPGDAELRLRLVLDRQTLLTSDRR